MLAAAAGVCVIETLVVDVAVHEPTLTVTVYTPPIAVVDPEMEGFCNDEVNPFGPLHE